MSEEQSLFSYPIDTIRQLMRQVMEDRQFFIEMRGLLKSSYFPNKVHAHIYQFVVEFFEKYRECPARHVIEMEAKTTYVGGDQESFNIEMAEIWKIPVTNVPWLKDAITRFVKDATVRDCLERSIKLADKQAHDAIPEVWRDLLRIQPAAQKTYLLSDIGTWMTTLTKHQNKISTGLPKLDKALEGGWGTGELNIFLAKTNVGKSIFLVHCALMALKRGHKVFFATCEMSKEKVARRLLMALSNMPWVELEAMLVGFGPEGVEKLFANMKGICNADVCIEKYPPGFLTAARLHADVVAQEAIMGFKFDMVVCDYMDEMAPNEGREKDPYESLRMIGQELIGMAEDLQVKLVTATQAQRSAGKAKTSTGTITEKPIESEETGDSYWSARLAHVMISLNQTQTQRSTGRIDLFVAKNRDGEKGQIIPAMIEYAKMKVSEVPDMSAVAQTVTSLGAPPNGK